MTDFRVYSAKTNRYFEMRGGYNGIAFILAR